MARARTSPGACDKKQAFATMAEARPLLDLLLISQPHGGAHAYRCDACQRIHLAGHPAHVYARQAPRWQKRRRKKQRRRHDEAVEPYDPAQFVWEVERHEMETTTTLGVTTELIDTFPPLNPNGIAPAIGTEVIHPTPESDDTIGHPGAQFAWVPVPDIMIDDTYQRTLSSAKVTDIVANFEPVTFGVVYLSRRADGTLWAIDGQHRCAAVEAKYGPHATKRVPSFILTGLSIEDEARIYYLMNRHRLQPTAYDGFRARLAFGDSVAREIKAILDQRGLAVVGGSSFRSTLRFTEIVAIAEVEQIYRAGWLPRTLDVIDAAWPGVEGAHRAAYLRGVRTFLETFAADLYGDDVSARIARARHDRVVDVLAGLGPHGLDNRAKFYAEAIGARTAVGMARGIHASFNRNLGQAMRLPAWGELGVETSADEEGS